MAIVKTNPFGSFVCVKHNAEFLARALFGLEFAEKEDVSSRTSAENEATDAIDNRVAVRRSLEPSYRRRFL